MTPAQLQNVFEWFTTAELLLGRLVIFALYLIGLWTLGRGIFFPACPLPSSPGGLKMTRILLLVLTLCLLNISADAIAKDKKPIEWKTGTLLDARTERGRRTVPINGQYQQLRDDQSYYVIDDGEKYTYLVRRSMTSRRDRPLEVTINGPIKFAVDDHDILLLDEKGKQHRLAIEQKALRQVDPESRK